MVLFLLFLKAFLLSMFKRTLSLIFLSFAGIVILAHTVIPHHHHHDQICFQNDISSHEHEDDKDSSDTCVLKLPVVLPSNREILEFRPDDGANNLLFVNSDQEYLSNYGLNHLISLSFLKDSSSGITFSYSLFVCSSSGLRAPPVV
jgi:hypothetical protein